MVMQQLPARAKHPAAFLTALLPIMLAGCQPAPSLRGVPVVLRERAECMYKVLKSTPGVSEPRVGSVTREGSSLPFLEYRAAETNSWVQPTHFEATRLRHDDYLFKGIVPGVIDPRVGYFDIHVTDEVVKRWETECQAVVLVISE